MCSLTPTFPSKQQEWYSASTMEYPWMSHADSFYPTLPSFDQSDEFKNYNIINLPPHYMNLDHINGSNNSNDQEEYRELVEKKLNHNARERDRRRKINALYSSLRALLPSSDQKRKFSIPTTVARVVKYIPEQKQELQRLSKRKHELLKTISKKKATMKHQQEQLRNREESIDSSPQKIAANWITDTEIAVQIATSKCASISDMLLKLEDNGLSVISVSSSVSSTASIFYTLHLEVRGDCRVRLEELDGMLSR